jgi:hypothetical protein
MFMAKIDLTAAYPTCGISPRYRDFYIFRFRGKFYRYRGQVMGITSAPRDFTRLLAPVIAFMRSFGVVICILIDDVWIGSMSSAQCAQDTQDVLIVLSFLGFVIEAKKTQLQPAQTMEWAGTIIDSVLMEFRVPAQKVKDGKAKFRKILHLAESKVPLPLRRWASVLGTMRSWQHCVFPAMLWSQPIQRFVARHIRRDKSCWDKLCPLPPMEVLDAVRKFLSPTFRQYNGRPIRPLPVDMLTESDASGYGAGMVKVSPEPTSDARWHWSGPDLPKHINWKELVATFRGLQALDLETPGLLMNRIIQNSTDNTCSLRYVNKFGGRILDMSLQAEMMWQWLLEMGSEVRDIFLPGVDNVLADTSSRMFIDRSMWKLDPKFFRRLNSEWGPLTVDGFAMSVNHQMRPFWSRWPDPLMAAVDAFQQDWAQHHVFAHPPYSLIPQVLLQIERQQVHQLTLIAPVWPTQAWWSTLLRLTVECQILGQMDSICFHPTKPRDFKPEHSWRVAAFRVSSACSNSRVIMNRLHSAFSRSTITRAPIVRSGSTNASGTTVGFRGVRRD